MATHPSHSTGVETWCQSDNRGFHKLTTTQEWQYYHFYLS